MEKYRPYKSAKEFLQAWKERGPFFSVRKEGEKCPNGYCSVSAFFDKRISFFTYDVDFADRYAELKLCNWSYDKFLEEAMWSDGTPCGVARKIESGGHAYVDLGLPSGTLWATVNVGAETETDYGLYFAWGETQGYPDASGGKSFNWGDYKYGTSASDLTKYNAADGLTTLEASDDAVTVNWGGDWHTPDNGQIAELLNTSNCTSAWVTNYDGSGVNGRLFRSRKNNNTLFVPAAGACYGGSQFSVGEYGYFWSRSLNSDDPQYAWFMGFVGVGIAQGDDYRYGGLSVRGVLGGHSSGSGKRP